jgi:hypothetical protein
MSDYRIVCVNTEHPHRHITHVGTGISASSYTQHWTVAEARNALARGDTFHTISPSTGKRADVHADTCDYANCDVKTLRSAADHIADNNLDNLPSCGS